MLVSASTSGAGLAAAFEVINTLFYVCDLTCLCTMLYLFYRSVSDAISTSVTSLSSTNGKTSSKYKSDKSSTGGSKSDGGTPSKKPLKSAIRQVSVSPKITPSAASSRADRSPLLTQKPFSHHHHHSSSPNFIEDTNETGSASEPLKIQVIAPSPHISPMNSNTDLLAVPEPTSNANTNNNSRADSSANASTASQTAIEMAPV
jgi:hypothetical protein